MISAFVSRIFGVRIKLTSEELLKVNERQRSEEWGTYVETKATFDILRIKYPYFDFTILMDQSSGHGKKIEGGLNAEEMGVRYGGSQPKMHTCYSP